ncbi:hypothetical protein Mal64_23370 [Pseudobythopirellula maris]|uniref:Uncharacterized protein n=1 Tax=Pseudobythopirellula maris TaxID=2527991 RepID=A0A5C5ZN33_9BACT|nr:hypothetical protein [Pseudobythopirellula maris]TWT88849.1 hypothetical protein Mal64_23370 [Pseudobythopirellula maris]
MPHPRRLLAFLAAAGFLIGCSQGPAPPDPKRVAAERERLMLAEEPADALSPLDYRETLEEGDGETASQVVLVGKVGGIPNPWGKLEPDFPWRENQAAFFLVDPATAMEFDEHDAGDPDHLADCPFCAREAANQASAVAAVNFSDAQGKQIAIGARELLGLKAGDTVVVRGEAQLLAGDLLVVEANGLFIRE